MGSRIDEYNSINYRLLILTIELHKTSARFGLWHTIDKNNTYFGVIPKDIFMIIYQMFPGQWWMHGFNVNSQYNCLNCNYIVKYHDILFSYKRGYFVVICRGCYKGYVIKEMKNELWIPCKIIRLVDAKSGQEHLVNDFYFDNIINDHIYEVRVNTLTSKFAMYYIHLSNGEWLSIINGKEYRDYYY